MGYERTRRLLGPLLRAAVRLRVEGAEHVPATGPALLASNHLSIVDSTFLPLATPRHITFMAKSEYFDGKGMMDRFAARFLRGSGQVPVQRGNHRAAVNSLQSCLEVLQRGEVFCIYPEGTRSPDGRLYRARTGVAWLALMSQAPVIPVAMFGTEKVLPPGSSIPRLSQVRVVFGKPVELSSFGTRADDAQTRRQVADAVIEAIAAISGQEYVPTYATAVKNRS